MIITKLAGGLGNQMFQYALGRRLALKHKTILKLDTSFLLDRTPKENFTYRNYELGVFAIESEIAKPAETAKFTYKPVGYLDKLIHRLPHRFRPYVVCDEPPFNYTYYETAITKSNRNTYLSGFWQSEKYFKDVESIIRSDFRFAVPPDDENETLLRLIGNVCSVSLHVRRSDYVDNQISNQYHGSCMPYYYQQAMQLVSGKVSNPHFFVFSDDPVWASEHLQFSGSVTFVNFNHGNKSYEDLRLMSHCRHHIIANSSFSWWGAWLNYNPNKMVIAPKQWINPDSVWARKHGIMVVDVLPKNWITL